MPRIRTVKPQFWLDEKLGEIPRDARLLYIGLWNLSDDQGVFEWRPTRIKVQLFPYDNDIIGSDIESWLELLVKTGDIIKFDNGTSSFGYIKSFLEHQEIKNPSKWRFAEIPPALPQPSDSPTPALSLGKRKRSREKESIKELEKRFNIFWKAYPKKVSKGQAERAFRKLQPDEKLLGIILAAIEQAKKSEGWTKENGKYIQHPSTWLNAMGWEDEISDNSAKSGRKAGEDWAVR